MSTHARYTRIRSAISALCLTAAPLLIAVFLLAGCGMTSSPTSPGPNTGSAFVIGTDAPLASVVSFNATIQSINAIDANNNSVSLVSGNPTVDFARYNGLQTLLDMNDVPAGTYTQIQVTFASATIGYLQTGSGAPTIATMPATFTTSTVTQTLNNPLVVSSTGPVGIHMDFRLDKSIQVSNGQITGDVNPTLIINAVGPGDPGAYIDEFIAGVVNPTASAQSFTMQGPHGRIFTVNVTGQTEWDNGEGLADLTSTSIVQISGTLDRADSTIDADEVAILTQNGFYAAGQITDVQPSSGPAADFQLYVRGTLPASGDGVSLGQIAQVNLSGSEKYFIYWMHNPLTQFLFNQSTLLPGQHVSVGGPLSGAANANAVTVKRVVLRDWGFNGTFVPGSIASGTFQMNINGFAGLLVPGQPVTVYTSPFTKFRDGFGALADVDSGTNLRVVGLLIKDPTSGNSVILARYIDDIN
ncbi:MAG TPA: DUF4382 domain-containing protein [Acidobacteriaceae bacterium]|jgi:hypothetical protein